MEKKACFIGHRNVLESIELRERIRGTVERLITEEGVRIFLFGSRSNFDALCHEIVSDFQQTGYPDIRRIFYTCRHECAIMKKDKTAEEEGWSLLLKHSVRIRDYDAEYEHPTKYTSGKASYVERNQAMIGDSDFCVFYYDEKYQPPRRKYGKKNLTDYQPKSGTAIAYRYAKKKKKQIINLFFTSI